MTEAAAPSLTWANLPYATRELLTGKLAGLWGAATDEAAFDSWTLDKKQGMLLLLNRMHCKGLWHLVKKVTNVYGEGGVGLQFVAWPMIESTLRRRRDFTRLFANHKDTTGWLLRKAADATQSCTFCFRKGRRESGMCISIFTVRFIRREAR